MNASSLLTALLAAFGLGHAPAAAAKPATAHHAPSHQACSTDAATFLNIDSCGAIGNGKTDDTAAIKAAFANARKVTCTKGKTYYVSSPIIISADHTTLNAKGCKFAPHITPSTSPVLDIRASHVTINGLYVIAGSGGSAVFAGMYNTISDVTLNDETCDGSDNPPMSGCNRIGNITNFKIDGWTSIATGYGLLQKANTNSHNVTIRHFYSKDMYADLIAENSVSGTSTNWVIEDGRFEGSHGYPNPATEQRFASFTTADGITISNVYVEHANGDSAVHLEGSAKNFRLTNATFKDNLATGGSDAYITYNNSENNITASHVKCIYASAGNAVFCFGGAYNAYSNALKFTDIECRDTTGNHAFNCFELAFHTGPTEIRASRGYGLAKFIMTKGTSNLHVSGTRLINTKDQ